jgi:hypothetical protein
MNKLNRLNRLNSLNKLIVSVFIGFIAIPSIAQTSASNSSSSAAKPADAYSHAVATEWMTLALSITQQTPGFSPPVASRALAYLSLSLYESTVAGMPGKLL